MFLVVDKRVEKRKHGYYVSKLSRGHIEIMIDDEVVTGEEYLGSAEL